MLFHFTAATDYQHFAITLLLSADISFRRFDFLSFADKILIVLLSAEIFHY